MFRSAPRFLALTACLVVLLGLFCSTAAEAQSRTGRYTPYGHTADTYAHGNALAAEGDRMFRRERFRDALESYQEAEEAFRESLSDHPRWDDARVRLGYVLYAMERSHEAVEILEEGLERNPESTGLRRMLGFCLYDLGRTVESVEVLEALEREGNAGPDVLFMLGKHHYEAEDYEEAARYFERYLLEVPSDVATHGNLGNAYLRSGRFDRALEAFEMVLTLEADNLAARINIGDTYYASARYERALEVYRDVLSDVDDNYRVIFNIGRSLLEIGEYEEAVSVFHHFRDLRPDLHQSHYFLGRSLVEVGRYGEARRALSRAADLDPEYARTFYWQGVVEARTGDIDAAVRALRRSRALDLGGQWLDWPVGDLGEMILLPRERVAWVEARGQVLWARILPDGVDNRLEPEVLALDGMAIVSDPEAVVALDLASGRLLMEHHVVIGGDRLHFAAGQYRIGVGGERCAGQFSDTRFLALCGRRLIYFNGERLAAFDTTTWTLLGERLYQLSQASGASATESVEFAIADVTVQIAGTRSIVE